VGWAGSCAVWSRTFATIHPMAWHYQENQDPRGGIDHRIEKTLERLADVNRSPRPTHNAPFTASPRCGIAFRAAIAAPKVLPALTSSLILRAFHTLRSVKDGGSATPPPWVPVALPTRPCAGRRELRPASPALPTHAPDLRRRFPLCAPQHFPGVLRRV
jgi:hypothetical protein